MSEKERAKLLYLGVPGVSLLALGCLYFSGLCTHGHRSQGMLSRNGAGWLR